MAPLVGSSFSKTVQSDLKVSTSSVIEHLIIGIENHEYEFAPAFPRTSTKHIIARPKRLY